ncbi:MAG: hypothetical protein ACOCXH_16350, partial [Cyclobacteriaceae bacterium]
INAADLVSLAREMHFVSWSLRGNFKLIYSNRKERQAFRKAQLRLCFTSHKLEAAAIDHEWQVAENAPFLSYDFFNENHGWVDIHSFVLPTHPINEYRKALFAVSIDDQPPIVIEFVTKNRSEEWKQNVSRNAARKVSQHFIDSPGKQTLKVWLIDTGVYFDRFIIDFGGFKESYLGPDSW